MSDKKMPSTFGATFAERAAAARGDKTFTSPDAGEPKASEPSTFASRKAVREGENKAVQAAENKAKKKA